MCVKNQCVSHTNKCIDMEKSGAWQCQEVAQTMFGCWIPLTAPRASSLVIICLTQFTIAKAADCNFQIQNWRWCQFILSTKWFSILEATHHDTCAKTTLGIYWFCLGHNKRQYVIKFSFNHLVCIAIVLSHSVYHLCYPFHHFTLLW